MELLKGRIRVDGREYRVHCALGVFRRGGERVWRGYLVTRENARFEHTSPGPHLLELDDGRSGEFTIIRVRGDKRGTSMVDFDGTGALNEPGVPEEAV